jgi:hypothetical protein
VKKFSVLSIVCLIATGPAWASDTSWAPTPTDVQKVDDEVAKLSNFSGFSCSKRNIAEFSRYYWGYTDSNGRHFINGQLRLPKDTNDGAGIHIVANPNHVDDGGCSVANVRYDADASKLVSATWGGR